MGERNKWDDRAEKMKNAGKSMQGAGNNMMGFGCLTTLLVTIPILLIIWLLI